MFQWIRIFTALLFVSLIGPAMAEGRIELSLAPHLDDAGRFAGVVSIEARNAGDQPVYFFGPQTPFRLWDDHLYGDWFDIRDESGTTIPYRGRRVNMRNPGSEAYIQLVPGESITTQFDLSVDYLLPSRGKISVGLSLVAYPALPARGVAGEYTHDRSEVFQSNRLEIEAEVISHSAQRGAFSDNVIPCSDEQLDQTREAMYWAHRSASLTQAILNLSYYYDPIDPQNPDASPRKHMRRDAKYVYWFGEWDDDAPQAPDPAAPATDNARVDEVMDAVVQRIERDEIVTLCDLCPGSSPFSKAWAEPDGRLHLCPSNFEDPIHGGITSQAGTLVHEVSHVGGERGRPTNDYPGVYNRATAHALERARAVHSAANYEYFSMNVPLGF